MKKNDIGKILVFNAKKTECFELCTLLSQQNYEVLPVYSLEELRLYLQEQNVWAVLIDFDSIKIENLAIRKLALSNPGISLLGLSKDRFHPELKDAICYHIYACLNKPVDHDELFYWLKCICDDAVDN